MEVMHMGRIHDIWAGHLAKMYRTKHRRRGVDIIKKHYAIEAARTKYDVYTSIDQLKRSRKPTKYLAVPWYLKSLALRLTKGTGIGVMSLNKHIIKKARSKR